LTLGKQNDGVCYRKKKVKEATHGEHNLKSIFIDICLFFFFFLFLFFDCSIITSTSTKKTEF